MDRSVHMMAGMKLGRPLEFDPDIALDAAMEVFWCHGYEGTSLSDLLSAMKLSKSSFYQTFGGKPQLFMLCLGRYQQQFAGELTTRLAQAPSGLEFIYGLFQWVAATAQEPAGGKGCFVGNSANEFGQRDPLFAKPIAQGLHRLGRIFKAAIIRAQREGDVAPTVNADLLASYLVSAMTGFRTVIKSGLDKRRAQSMVPVILKALG